MKPINSKSTVGGKSKKSASRYSKKRTNSRSRSPHGSVVTGDEGESVQNIGFTASYGDIAPKKHLDAQTDQPESPSSRPKTTEHADKPRKIPNISSRSIANQQSPLVNDQ